MRRPTSTAIIIEGVRTEGLATKVYDRVVDTLARVVPAPAVARIIFADENGSKGGVDTRCTIVFHVPRRRDLSVAESGENAEMAFELACDALVGSVTRERGRRRELVRRPKKYFLAKRLLAPEVSVEAPVAAMPLPRPKRARRRRVA